MDLILNDIIEENLKNIQASQRMKECLYVRLSLLKKHYAKKDEYEKNEVDILKMQTAYKIEQLESIIRDKDNEFQENFERYIEELEFDEKAIE